MANQMIVLSVVLAIIAVSNATDWCDITCKRDGFTYKHTMCIFKQSRPASQCYRVLKQDLDQSEINDILKYHNKVRRDAANLPPLVWDKSLATVAQRWANQCDFDHDKCRDMKVGKHIGQNVALSTGSEEDVDLEYLMSQWSGEKSYVNRNIIASYPSDKSTQRNVGHYTQMVWRETTKIGCGYIMYFGPYDGKNEYVNYLVCNYGVGGNLRGARVY